VSEPLKLRPRERDALIQSLRAGVVPSTGIQHIQVGRAAETKAMIRDVERVADGGSAVRFVIGDYGAGKTFFLNLVRAVALEKKLVTMHADLNPDRRLHSTGGKARALVAELTRNAATRSKPEGGALASVVERFITAAIADARTRSLAPAVVIQDRLNSLTESVGGFDFAEVVGAYWRGHDTQNETLKSDAVRWLRGEFASMTDARKALGVRTIVDDDNVYDHLKLLARFSRLAGYSGLLVGIDEMVNLYRIPHARSRQSNYEQLLRILNDCLQGSAAGLGALFGGTTDFLTDTRRGLYSYEALQSRLAPNNFASAGVVDHSAPVLRLDPLTQEDLFILLTRLQAVFASGDAEHVTLKEADLQAFMAQCRQRLGDTYFRTPRTTIVEFLNLLSILDQNPNEPLERFLKGLALQPDVAPDSSVLTEEDDELGDLKTFKL
jgi:hypothetical protein